MGDQQSLAQKQQAALQDTWDSLRPTNSGRWRTTQQDPTWSKGTSVIDRKKQKRRRREEKRRRKERRDSGPGVGGNVRGRRNRANRQARLGRRRDKSRAPK